MIVEIEFVHIATSEALSDFVHRKLEGLEKRYPWVLKSIVHFEKENDTKGKGKLCSIKAEVSGLDPFAKSNEETYEGAFKESMVEIEKQLEKRKQQMKQYM